jgi:hypothetical protein
MNKKAGNWQRNLVITGLIIAFLTAAAVIYSLSFLSNNLLRALRPPSLEGQTLIEFNLSGFKALGL